MSEQKKVFRPMQAEEYLSVRQAANIMGVSTRSVYGYIEAGKLRGIRIGASIAVHAEDVRTYQRAIVGRPRTRVPAWRKPAMGNEQYLTLIQLRLRKGREKQLEKYAEQIRQKQLYRLKGTVARFLVRDQKDPRNVQIHFVWRKLVMPEAEEREREIRQLLDDLADLVETDQIKTFECQTLLQA
jgi:excisionase family DNA binding protein